MMPHWRYGTTAKEDAEALLDAEIRKVVPDEEAASALSSALKDYIAATVAEEKCDLRDEINKSGTWSPDY